jgi:hypothetical protein
MKKSGKYYFRNAILLIALISFNGIIYAQTPDKELIPKVSHVEPLFVDLVRDLGARKGEKEINLAADFRNIRNYNEYGILAEYEFAPINRLGLEIETDFLFFKRTEPNNEVPGNKLDNLKLSAQYSFLVSPEYNTTLAIGYTQIFAFTDFKSFGNSKLITKLVYSPFFIAAKRWGDNFHTLILTGPQIEHDLVEKATDVNWQINTSVFYSVPNSHHFIGIEFNKEFVYGEFDITMRPQVKVQLNDDLAIGLVAGFPMKNNGEKISSFFRIIYEL